MLSAILSSVGGAFFDKLFGNMRGAFEAYLNKQISLEELRAQMVVAAIAAAKDIEASHADALAKTYASFMDALKTSKLLQAVWASVTISQLLVLLWHQVGIPALVYFGHGPYPSSGGTVEWAYALLGGCVGFGPLVLRNGPGAISPEKLKALISK